MSNGSTPENDEELRRQIRKEIEERDRLRRRQQERHDSVRSLNEEAEKRRRIYQEEIRKYYQNRPGYREIVREDGEVDWVPENEAALSERLFDEVLEDPDVAKKRMKIVLLLGAVFVLLIIAGLYSILHQPNGTIIVECNVPDAQIILDTNPLDLYTNATLAEIPAGEHVVTVVKPGFRMEGDPIQKVDLRGGKTIKLSFVLLPDDSTAVGGSPNP
jgi:hypothetical protein